jgi:hypothetical protein
MCRQVNYLGATETELRTSTNMSRLWGLADQRRLFPHHGIVRLEPEAMVLEGW